MSSDLLQVTPPELKFRFELRKQIPSSLSLYNPTSNYVAFKVKTTSPKKYCVRPNTGMVAPGNTTEVTVIMQQQKETPPDLAACKDKFLVQSVIVDDVKESTDFAVLFAKEKKDQINEAKLKVSYIVPNAPPSPVPEHDEADYEPPSRTTPGDSTVLAQERNAALAEADRMRRELGQYVTQVEKMRTQAGAIGGKAATVAGFSLIHLLLTALLAFLIGRFTDLLGSQL